MGPSKLDANIARTKRGVSSDFRWRHLGHAIRVRMVDAIMRRIRSQTGKRAMMELDDHLLRDIGLTRDQARPGYSPISDGRWLVEQARLHER